MSKLVAVLVLVVIISILTTVVSGDFFTAVKQPFQVTLIYKGKTHCLGAYINTNSVLTTASCIKVVQNDLEDRGPNGTMQVEVGKVGSQLIGIKEIIMPDEDDNHFAIIKLTEQDHDEEDDDDDEDTLRAIAVSQGTRYSLTRQNKQYAYIADRDFTLTAFLYDNDGYCPDDVHKGRLIEGVVCAMSMLTPMEGTPVYLDDDEGEELIGIVYYGSAPILISEVAPFSDWISDNE